MISHSAFSISAAIEAVIETGNGKARLLCTFAGGGTEAAGQSVQLVLQSDFFARHTLQKCVTTLLPRQGVSCELHSSMRTTRSIFVIRKEAKFSDVHVANDSLFVSETVVNDAFRISSNGEIR